MGKKLIILFYNPQKERPLPLLSEIYVSTYLSNFITLS